MGYDCYDEYYDEEEFEEDDEEELEEEEEEEAEVYDYVESVERKGSIIEIKVSPIDICCSAILQLPVDQALKLVRELAKKLNKDEVKELFSILVDVVTSK